MPDFQYDELLALVKQAERVPHYQQRDIVEIDPVTFDKGLIPTKLVSREELSKLYPQDVMQFFGEDGEHDHDREEEFNDFDA